MSIYSVLYCISAYRVYPKESIMTNIFQLLVLYKDLIKYVLSILPKRSLGKELNRIWFLYIYIQYMKVCCSCTCLALDHVD